MKQPGKTPSLAALRVFEAAARLGSVSAAAGELHVTHSAVSQKIKALEDSMGVRLFGRSGRHIVLTVAGRELALGVNEALCALAQTTRQVLQRANPNRLTVTTLPSFASCWLTPRIGRFIEQEPDVEINLISTSTVLDFTRDGVDAAIRWMAKPDESLDATLLMHDEMIVVASPDYLRDHPVQEPADLAGCALLRADDESWLRWFERAGLDWGESSKGVFFNDSSLALRWAEIGRGVVLTRRSLAAESLHNGALVQLFDITVPEERIYWFVTPADLAPTPLLQRFRDWVFKEAATSLPQARPSARTDQAKNK